MKHSAALKIKVGDVIAVNNNRDGILYQIKSILFPVFIIQELHTNTRVSKLDYCYFQKPTSAQLNAYKKRKEKYYASNDESNTNTTSS